MNYSRTKSKNHGKEGKDGKRRRHLNEESNMNYWAPLSLELDVLDE